ncbi:unnamed protein product [Caenorhabditis sp. 36 PRJEB53466]|nr:unnamed protein product [Caenorhabditis sp. 36 PRJEB53466]
MSESTSTGVQDQFPKLKELLEAIPETKPQVFKVPKLAEAPSLKRKRDAARAACQLMRVAPAYQLGRPPRRARVFKPPNLEKVHQKPQKPIVKIPETKEEPMST